MSGYIRTGYVHLINPTTATLSLSECEFDTVSGIGGYLGNALNNILDNHNRRPGTFKPNSKLKDFFSAYSVGRIDLEELSHQIAKTIFKVKTEEYTDDPTTLFVLEGDNVIYVLEIKRDMQYRIKPTTKDGKNNNSIERESIGVPKIRADQVKFCSVCLKTLNVTTLESSYPTEDESYVFIYSDVVLRATMDKSLNYYVNAARSCFYNTIVDKQEAGNEVYKDKTRVNLLNRFETEMKNHLSTLKEINFHAIARQLFKDKGKENRFIHAIEEYGIKRPVKALSDKMIKLNYIEHIQNKVTLKNGVQIIIPDDVDQQQLNINLTVIDGEFKEQI